MKWYVKLLALGFAYIVTVPVAFLPFWLAACFVQAEITFGPISRAWLAACCIYVGGLAIKKWMEE